MSFDSLGLSPDLLSAVKEAGYSEPTPVQLQAVPQAIQGADLMVSSSTGSGKTAAFMLPALQRMITSQRLAAGANDRMRRSGPAILILTPTRELALQVSKAAEIYGRNMKNLRVCTVMGGVPYGLQIRQLRGPIDILIATPGRLMDHMRSNNVKLNLVELLVLDEADRMLDMGFIDDIEMIAKALPATRQTMMFSATFAGTVAKLAANLLRSPQRIELASHRDTHADITQQMLWADDLRHKDALLEHLLRDADLDQAIVFTSTQRDADALAGRLEDQGHAAAALHGGMPQGQRTRTLNGLRTGRLRVLVATDVAARGIDVPTISHVINYGLPMSAEDYVHRIGRTGRAGRSGLAVTLVEHRDAMAIKRIERFTSQKIPVSTIVGLEPKRVMKPQTARPAPGQRPRGAGPGTGPGRGAAPGSGYGKPRGEAGFRGDGAGRRAPRTPSSR